MLKKTKVLVESMAFQDSQPSRYLDLIRKVPQLIIKEEEKLIQLFKELYKPFNLKLAKEWVKRAVEDKKAQEANPQVEEEEAEDLAKMKSLFLITLTLMSW
jgi:hypothetical protein